LLALLEQPSIALLLAGGENRQLTAADLAGSLLAMAQWSSTTSLGLLLAPDAQRRSHPSMDLEPEQRALADLAPPSASRGCPLLNLTPGAFIHWS
jgi:3,4-dihydroxy 2-butanone 4-phosphate synthase/GTP cyclohydrolase II